MRRDSQSSDPDLMLRVLKTSFISEKVGDDEAGKPTN